MVGIISSPGRGFVLSVAGTFEWHPDPWIAQGFHCVDQTTRWCEEGGWKLYILVPKFYLCQLSLNGLGMAAAKTYRRCDTWFVLSFRRRNWERCITLSPSPLLHHLDIFNRSGLSFWSSTFWRTPQLVLILILYIIFCPCLIVLVYRLNKSVDRNTSIPSPRNSSDYVHSFN
jgi:hypothetical protein